MLVGPESEGYLQLIIEPNPPHSLFDRHSFCHPSALSFRVELFVTTGHLSFNILSKFRIFLHTQALYEHLTRYLVAGPLIQ